MRTTIGQYLIDRLLAAGADHMFGVPGDFIIGWMSRAEKSRLKRITTSDEQGAGFAADAYARRGQFTLIEAKLARMECSDTLRRLGEAMHLLVSKKNA